jgi:hypothetical protein
MSRENPSNKVMGIKPNAIMIGIIISKSLSEPVKKETRAAPGNNINHPIRQSPNDQGHKTPRTLWIFEGNLLQVLRGEFRFSPISTAINPRMGGPKPPPPRSIKKKGQIE